MSQAISDRYGLPLSTSSPVASEHYVEAIDAIISQTYGAGRHLGMAVEADDGFALGHATLALASMFGYDPVKAKGHLADTHARAKGLSRREEHQIAIIDTWINGNSPRALELIREHSKTSPATSCCCVWPSVCSSLGAVAAGWPTIPPISTP